MTDINDVTPTGAPASPTGDDHAQQESSAQGQATRPAQSQPEQPVQAQQSAAYASQPAASHSAQPIPPVQPTQSYRQHPQSAPQPAQPAQNHYQSVPHGAPHVEQHAGTVTYEKKGHGMRTFWIAFAGALVACVVAFGALGIFNAVSDGSSGAADGGSSTVLGSQDNTSTSGSADKDLTLAESVAEKCLPSVAAIDVYTSQSSLSSMYGFGYGSGSSGSDTLTQSSLGSGVVLTEDGYVLTNYHVIEDGEAFKVTIGGEQYDADVVGSDPSSDIAVIKAREASGLTAMEIGNSDDLIIGEWVMTLGSPFGLEQSVATGIVSATSRSQIMDSSTDMYGQSTGETTIYPNMIQTDAAINPGNSGGALVDADGKLIGINTLITSYSGNYSGVGFAIPVNYAINLAQQIIDGKTPTHAQLGVSLSTVSAQTAQRYGLAVDSGAYVAAVSAGSGAAEAGIQEGDIITAFDGEPVESASDLMLDVRSKNPGDKVTLTVNRDGETSDVEVTLGSDESSEAENAQGELQQQGAPNLLDRLFGDGGFDGGGFSDGRQDQAA